MAKADLEKAKREFPSTGMGEAQWLAFFDTPAGHHAMGRIIGDIYDVVKAEREKEDGLQRMGRRPRRQGSLEDVYATVFPAPYTMDPFPESMLKLLAGRSQRQFAPKIPVHQTTMSRLMSGALVPDKTMLERIAHAAKVHPSYFVEWRAMYVSEMVQSVMTNRPNIGVTAYKHVRDGSVPR
jgi:hypothetical protein